jgi:SulP family sulfate permease
MSDSIMNNSQASGRMTPKLFEALRSYHRQDFFHDVVAGVTVGLVALPLAMAFAISSGVKPEAGIYTAIVAGLVVSTLGGSRCQIAGPTGAFVVIVAGIVTKFEVAGLMTCTLMAGVMLVLMGLTGLGSTIRYIPRSVTIGFTNGIAVLIASTQVKDFLGLSIEHVPSEFLERAKVLGQNLGTTSPVTFAVAACSLVIVLIWPRVTKRLPGSIVALLLATVVSAVSHLKVETIGSKFGGIPVGLPPFQLPELRFDLFTTLMPSALTVAMLAAIESLLSAVVADNMSGDRHKPDVELTAQGAANLIVPFFGGIPVTGAIARTATNIRSGARSPVAGIVHALTLVVILVAAAPLARFIPLATLSAVLFVVAYNMGEWREIGPILSSSWADRLVWASTFALTVFADLTVAVEVGMVLAAFLYIRQVTETTSVEPVTEEYIKDGRAHILQDKPIPPYVTILRIHGPFLFGATSKLEEATSSLNHFGAVVILRLRNMTALDGTGLHALEAFAKRVRSSGRSLVMCGARRQPFKLIRHSKLIHILGRENLVPHVEAALQRAQAHYEDFGGVGRETAQDLTKHPI